MVRTYLGAVGTNGQGRQYGAYSGLQQDAAASLSIGAQKIDHGICRVRCQNRGILATITGTWLHRKRQKPIAPRQMTG